jgi:hypothetical protein
MRTAQRTEKPNSESHISADIPVFWAEEALSHCKNSRGLSRSWLYAMHHNTEGEQSFPPKSGEYPVAHGPCTYTYEIILPGGPYISICGSVAVWMAFLRVFTTCIKAAERRRVFPELLQCSPTSTIRQSPPTGTGKVQQHILTSSWCAISSIVGGRYFSTQGCTAGALPPCAVDEDEAPLG